MALGSREIERVFGLRESMKHKVTVVSLLLGSALSLPLGSAQAQNATVKVTVRGPGGEFVDDVRVQAKNLKNLKNAKSRIEIPPDKTKPGSYTIERLPAGSYDFIACDGVAYVPFHKSQTVEAHDTLAVELDLSDNSSKPEHHSYPEASGSVVVHLIHKETGCEVAAVPTDENGEFDFRGRIPEDYYAQSRNAPEERHDRSGQPTSKKQISSEHQRKDSFDEQHQQ